MAAVTDAVGTVAPLQVKDEQPEGVPIVTEQSPGEGAAAPNIVDEEEYTDLHRVIMQNNTKASLDLLRKQDCDLNAKTKKDGLTPLHLAIHHDLDEVARRLINKDCDLTVLTEYGFTPLHSAARVGNVKIAGLLIEKECDINAKTQYNHTPLHIASQEGHLKVAELLIEKKCKIDEKTKDQFTALHLAVKHKRSEIARFLIHKGSNVAANTCTRNTALHYAAENGLTDVADLLVEKGSPVDAKTMYYFTPLHNAIKNGHLIIAERLLDHKDVDKDAETKEGLTPLHLAIKYRHRDIAGKLIKMGCKVNQKTSDGFKPMHFVAKYGNLELAQALIKRGCSVNDVSKDGYCPLLLALNSRQNAIAQKLVNDAKENEVQMKTKQGITALHFAAKLGDKKIIDALIKKGVHVNSATSERDGNDDTEKKDVHEAGSTPLHFAAQHGKKYAVVLLISKGSRLNDKTHEGNTPLHLAIKYGYEDTASTLIQKGCDIKEATGDGQTPLHYTARHGSPNVTKELLEGGADVNASTHDGFQPLHFAAKYNKCGIALQLLEHVDDIDAACKKGLTPLYLAVMNGSIETVCLLIEAGANVSIKPTSGTENLVQMALKSSKEEIVRELLGAGSPPPRNYKGNEVLEQYLGKRKYIIPGSWQTFQNLRQLENKTAKESLEINLYEAAKEGKAIQLRRLLLAEISPEGYKDEEGHTAAQVAFSKEHSECIKWLKTIGKNGWQNIPQVDTSKVKISGLVQVREKFDERFEPSNYKMKSKPRGYAIIINFEDYNSELANRKGSRKDIERMRQLWTALHFNARTYDNLSAETCYELLTSISQDDRLKKHDCFVLCLMGHGEDGKIIDTTPGKNPIDVEKVLGLFSSENCCNLEGKPKLFFIQSCRDVKENVEKDAVVLKEPQPVLLNAPTSSDQFVMYSTARGCASYRTKTDGSLLINAVVQVFEKYACVEHLGELAARVTKDVSDNCITDSGKTTKQCPHITSSLRHRLYFLPCRHVEVGRCVTQPL